LYAFSPFCIIHTHPSGRYQVPSVSKREEKDIIVKFIGWKVSTTKNKYQCTIQKPDEEDWSTADLKQMQVVHQEYSIGYMAGHIR